MSRRIAGIMAENAFTRAGAVPGGIGDNALRPEAADKTRGVFPYASDLQAAGMLWGHTVRSPHPSARIRGLDVTVARGMPGVRAVLTHHDVPGVNRFGLKIADQPVLVEGLVRYQGEAVVVVAADTAEQARRACEAVDVEYDVLPVLSDPREAAASDAPVLHPGGNVVARRVIRRGDTTVPSDVVVRGEYEVGMQDQAPLGMEAGLAIPTADQGVELHVASQFLHIDRAQLAVVLDLPPEKVRMRLAGVGGAFGAREDLTLHAHLCLLAMRTGRPVKMVYTREESFLGHVHRHPARMWYEHGATRDGKLTYVKCSVLLDGGAYASTSPSVVNNAAGFSVGPYECPAVDIEATAVYTNNPPCGAMRGFGAVQVAFAHESQMDLLAAELGLHPLELRRRNAMVEGSLMPTGQPLRGPVPVLEMLERLERMPLPGLPESGSGAHRFPGGAGNVTIGEGVRRGVGYGIGFKNGGTPRDYSTARVRLYLSEGEPVAEVHTAAAEMGQGILVVQGQIVRTELGVSRVVVRQPDTLVGSAGSSSASRQTYMTGGAVARACEALRERLLCLAYERVGHRWPELLELSRDFTLGNGSILAGDGAEVLPLAELLDEEGMTEERVFWHRDTRPMDPSTGQGEPHLQFLFAAHRAVTDVDCDTGLVKVVHLGAVQDVGRAVNPVAVEGQMEGGTVQSLGLALMEEVQLSGGRVLNASFTDYLIPTVLDVPPMQLDILEYADPDAPYGIKGAGEQSTLSATPAIVASLRDATSHRLPRVPVRMDDLVGLAVAAPVASERPPLP
jgi:xanthine dehydrogenase D subunit